MTFIELLSPARNLECGIAAVDHGADAVYIGSPRFGARAAAGNSVEDIATLCSYAHRFGARVYVTVNTILYDDELTETEGLLWQLYRAGVDAFIVQDLALLQMNLPPVPLHASTQMDNRTPDQVQWLADMGYSQVVLARECGLEDIRRIHHAVPQMPLEVFVHGALCVSYSGRCMASQYCFSRSANRGQCAQFCRLPFSLEDATGRVLAKDKYLLSLRDMNRTASLEEMMDAGVRSFKIEGRLKDVAYVKNVTAWYRQRIDAILKRRSDVYARASYGTVNLSFTPNPERSFSRGFTEYFLHDRREPMASLQTPKSRGQFVGTVKDVRPDCIVVSGIVPFSNGDGLCFLDAQGRLQGFRVNRVEGNHLYPAEKVRVDRRTSLYRSFDQEWEHMMSRPTALRTLTVKWTVSDVMEGFRLRLEREDGVAVEQVFPREHQLAQTDQREVIAQLLAKLGDTIYRSAGVEVCLSQPWFVPRSVWAEWRRAMVALLDGQEPARHGQNHGVAPCRPSGRVQAFNVSNRLSARSYEQAGFSEWTPALEVDASRTDGPLMECRYCIRHELGICARQPKASLADLHLPLYLRSQDGRRFPLQFDCARCRMLVMPDTPVHK